MVLNAEAGDSEEATRTGEKEARMDRVPGPSTAPVVINKIRLYKRYPDIFLKCR